MSLLCDYEIKYDYKILSLQISSCKLDNILFCDTVCRAGPSTFSAVAQTRKEIESPFNPGNSIELYWK